MAFAPSNVASSLLTVTSIFPNPAAFAASVTPLAMSSVAAFAVKEENGISSNAINAAAANATTLLTILLLANLFIFSSLNINILLTQVSFV